MKKGMKYQGVKTLEVLEGADNYNCWIADRLKAYIKSPALEIGAGTGNISSSFTSLKSLVLTDIDTTLVKQLRSKFSGKKNVAVETLNIESSLGKVNNLFQTVYSVNVLEHIRDDRKALDNMNKMLKKGGRIVLLVPAKKWAFTKLDKSLGHFRRYEKKELREKIENSGFEIESIEFFNILGLLSWMVRDRVSRNHLHLNKGHVKVFDTIVPFLRRIEPKRGLPAGISLIVVARKK